MKKTVRHEGERGAIILALMVAVVIMMILMGRTVQSLEVMTQREREEEFLSRSRQIIYAIERFQKDNGALPTKMEQLLEPGPNGNSRYIRHPWKDPLTGGDWVLLWMAPDGASLFRSDGRPSTTGSFRTTPQGQAGGNVDPAAQFNMQQLNIPLGSPGYDADKTKSLLDTYRKTSEGKVGSNSPFANSNANLGGFDLDSQVMSTAGVGPIAGVATSLTGPAFREWKGHGEYEGYEISLFSFRDDQKGPDPNLNAEKNMWEMPGRAVPDPLSPEGRKLLNTDAGSLGSVNPPRR